MPSLPYSVAPLADRGFTLENEQHLHPGECLRSRNRRIAALVTREGQFILCLTATTGEIMDVIRTEPAAERPSADCYAIMQGDGNFSLYAGTGPGNRGAHLWSSLPRPAGPGPYFAILEDDGNFSVGRGTYAKAVVLVWTTNSRIGIPPDPAPMPGGRGGFSVQAVDSPDAPTPIGFNVVMIGSDGRGAIVKNQWQLEDRTKWVLSYVQDANTGRAITAGDIPAPYGWTDGIIAGGDGLRPFHPRHAGTYRFLMLYDYMGDDGRPHRENYRHEFEVVAPRVVLTRKEYGPPRITHFEGINPVTRLQLGTDIPVDEAGIRFRFYVVAPAGCDGHLAVIQLVRSHRQWNPRSSAPIAANTPDQAWMLDTTFAGDRPDRWTRIVGGVERAAVNYYDAPGMGLRDWTASATVEEEFRTYLCFKPDGDETCWMPIYRVDWSWGAAATRDFFGEWQVRATHGPGPDNVRDYPDAGELPQWYGNIATVREEAHRRFPARNPHPPPEPFTWLNRNNAARLFAVIGGAAVNLARLYGYLGPFTKTGDNRTFIWTSQREIQALRDYADTSGLVELPPADRLSSPNQRVAATATKYAVLVAPQCLLTRPDDEAIAEQISPFTVQQVGSALIYYALTGGAVASVISTSHHQLHLLFREPPSRATLLRLAAHPQAFRIEIAPETPTDDPSTRQQ